MVEERKRILIAEDDNSIIEVMSLILEGEGYRISQAKDKQAVFQALKKTLPDLLFLDINLGGDNGEEIAQEIKRGEKTATVPLVLLSADENTKQIATRVDAAGFLLKPFDIDLLLSTVRAHIRS